MTRDDLDACNAVHVLVGGRHQDRHRNRMDVNSKDKGLFYCVNLYLIPFFSLNNRELLASTGLLGFQDLRSVLGIQHTVVLPQTSGFFGLSSNWKLMSLLSCPLNFRTITDMTNPKICAQFNVAGKYFERKHYLRFITLIFQCYAVGYNLVSL